MKREFGCVQLGPNEPCTQMADLLELGKFSNKNSDMNSERFHQISQKVFLSFGKKNSEELTKPDSKLRQERSGRVHQLPNKGLLGMLTFLGKILSKITQKNP